MPKTVTKKLSSLLKSVVYECNSDFPSLRVSSVTADSRLIKPGALFVAVKGEFVDGHYYINDAVAKGAKAIIVEGSSEKYDSLVPILSVENSRYALGIITAAFYGFPAKKMKMIGITGTNGKTTVSYLLESLIKESGGKPGVIGTINYRYNGIVDAAALTTPHPEILQPLLDRMLKAGVTHVVMEVSSHSLHQDRLAGLHYDIGLFTNLSHDHLDYHGDMESYFASKKRLFSSYLSKKGKAVIVDPQSGDQCDQRGDCQQIWSQRLADELADEWGQAAAQRKIVVCGMKQGSVRVKKMQTNLLGVEADLESGIGYISIRSSLVGEFNLRNLLGAAGVGVALRMKPEIIARALSSVSHIPGRLEKVLSAKNISVFVDYAHTPDAIENVLKSLKKLKPGRLIVVFGCGGDRDAEKRPMMGDIAGRHADVAIVTSDNPRTEDPQKILRQVEKGVSATAMIRQRAETILQKNWQGFYDIIESRRSAIRVALRYAQKDDVIVVCGKGHEDYQITTSGKIFFDDRLEAKNCLLN